METTVKLQEQFSYSLVPIILLGILVIGFVIYIIISKVIKAKGNIEPENVEEPEQVFDLYSIKWKYLEMLNIIGRDTLSHKNTVKISYQLMSMCIRNFVYDVTGIKVQNYTLLELNQLGMPVLVSLISEFYYPEFANNEVDEYYDDRSAVTDGGKLSIGKSVDDVLYAIEKTKRIIEIWN